MSDSKALSLGEYDKITLLKLLDRLGGRHDPGAEPQTDQNLMAKCCLDAAKMIRSLDKSANALCEVVGGHFMHAVKPTHCAVVDEYGEIIYSRRIIEGVDVEAGLRRFIDNCQREPETRAEAKGWAIKGVTVNA